MVPNTPPPLVTHMKANVSILSVIPPHRNEKHLELLLDHLDHIRTVDGFNDFELVLVEGGLTRGISEGIAERVERQGWVRYLPARSQSYDKASLLNEGAAIAAGRYVMPYNIGLIPSTGVLAYHISLALASPVCLISGYRLRLLKCPSAPFAFPPVNELLEESFRLRKSLVCPEDSYSTLLKCLLHDEQVALCPCVPAAALNAVGGFSHFDTDAPGREELDLLRRLRRTGLTPVRCYELLYLQLPN